MYKDGGKSRLYPTSYHINRAQRDTLHKIRYGKYRSFVHVYSCQEHSNKPNKKENSNFDLMYQVVNYM